MFKNLRILRPVLAILILFIPLYPKFPLTSVDNTYVAIRLDDIIVALSLIIWGLYQLKTGLPVLKLKTNKLFILYFLAILAGFVTALFIYQTTPKNLLILNLFRHLEYMSLFFIAASAIETKEDLKYPFVFLIIATVGVLAYGMGQKYFGFPVISTMNAEFSKGQLLQMNIWTRISSTFAGHYDLAVYSSVVLIIIGCIFLYSKYFYIQLPLLLIWIATFYMLTLTASRVSTFAFWGGMVLTLFALKKYIWIFPVSLLVLFSIFNSKDLNQRLLATIPSLRNQLSGSQIALNQPTPIPLSPTPTAVISTKPAVSTTGKPVPTVIHHGPIEIYQPADIDAGVARSGEIRFNVEWPRAITAFKKNFLTGTGLGSITLATDNDFLRLLGESGLLGFVSFMAILAYFGIRTIPFIFKKKRNHLEVLSIIFFGGLVAVLANATFIDVFEASKTAYLIWIMMGIYYRVLELNSQK